MPFEITKSLFITKAIVKRLSKYTISSLCVGTQIYLGTNMLNSAVNTN